MGFATRRLTAVVSLAALAGLTVFSSPAPARRARPAPTGSPHWEYEGPTGPDHWGDLAPEYRLCKTGRRQSPIDLAWATPRRLPEIAVDYRIATEPMRVEHTGHTIQVTAPPGNRIVADGVAYQLKQFHFHLPSEHTLHGRGTAMEVHFVHETTDGQRMAIGVLMEYSRPNTALAPLWKVMPTAPGTAVLPAPFDLQAILPARRTTYRYDGSLTTPPCTEGVHWAVHTAHIPISHEQAAAYRRIFHKSNRPAQSRNERPLLVTR